MNVLITSNAMHPSAILCGHRQMSYLKDSGLLDGYRFAVSEDVRKEDLDWADIIIFIRSDSEYDVYLSEICKKAGKHLVYVLDDDVFIIPSSIPSSAHYRPAAVQDNIRKIMENCDTLLSPSDRLLAKYAKHFQRAFRIEEPSVANDTEGRREKDGIIRIGFAGSLDRTQDVADIVSEALKKIHEEYPQRVKIEFMGARPSLVDELGLEYHPYCKSYDDYIEVMRANRWDIGLAPMPSMEFHASKYFNKYIEYSSFGIAGIYSSCEPYTSAIEDGRNGLLADNDTESWVRAIKRLIDDPELRNTIVLNSRKERKELYSIEKLSGDYLDKILQGYQGKGGPVEAEGMALERTVSFAKRLKRKFNEEDVNIPRWAMEKIKEKIRNQRNAG